MGTTPTFSQTNPPERFEMEAVSSTGANFDSAPQPVATERLIVRNGDISISTESTRGTRAEIEAIVSDLAEYGAFVVSANESGRGEGLEPYISITIRVPVETFSSVMNQIGHGFARKM